MQHCDSQWEMFVKEAEIYIARELESEGVLEDNLAFLDKYFAAKQIDLEVLNYVQNLMCNVVLYEEDLLNLFQTFSQLEPNAAREQLLKMMNG